MPVTYSNNINLVQVYLEHDCVEIAVGTFKRNSHCINLYPLKEELFPRVVKGYSRMYFCKRFDFFKETKYCIFHCLTLLLY